MLARWRPFALLLEVVSAFHLYVPEGGRRCFVNIVPSHAVVSTRYRLFNDPGLKCVVDFETSRGERLYSKELEPYGPDDDPNDPPTQRAAYRVTDERQTVVNICLSCPGSVGWFGAENKLKWELTTDVGDINFVSTNAATTGSFSDVEKTALSVLSRMDAMVAEMDYEQTFENRFFHQAESLATRVTWMNGMKLLLVAGATVFQVTALVGFFRSQKLI